MSNKPLSRMLFAIALMLALSACNTVSGIGKDIPPTEWRGFFRQLVAASYLAADTEGYGTLQLTDRARPLLRPAAFPISP